MNIKTTTTTSNPMQSNNDKKIINRISVNHHHHHHHHYRHQLHSLFKNYPNIYDDIVINLSDDIITTHYDVIFNILSNKYPDVYKEINNIYDTDKKNDDDGNDNNTTRKTLNIGKLV